MPAAAAMNRSLLESSLAEARRERPAAFRLRSAARALRLLASLGAIAGTLAAASAVVGATRWKAADAPPGAGSLTGQLLVATPELNDPRFVRTVIYMVRHDANGAMGLVVNRPFKEVPIALLLDRLGADSKGVRGAIRLHYGGPVEPGRAFMLHSAEYAAEGTQVIAGGFALTGEAEVLRAIGAGAGPRRALFALGYAGWGPGQLEGEFRAGAWVTVPADPALVFEGNADDKWERAMARRKIDL